jgi:hypothetical protein
MRRHQAVWRRDATLFMRFFGRNVSRALDAAHSVLQKQLQFATNGYLSRRVFWIE